MKNLASSLSCLLVFLFLNPLWAGRVVFMTLEGDFEQEYRIVEQSGVWRIDAITHNWSILYDSKSGQYTGLEHRDAGYWRFRWDDVQRGTQNTKHHLNRLSDLNIEGFASYDLTRPQVESKKEEPWTVTATQKEESWMDLKGRFWLLTQPEKGKMMIQTVNQSFLKPFLAHFRVIHEQIRLAVIRPLWSEKVDETLVALGPSGDVPVKIEWGSEKAPSYWKINRFEEKTEEPASFFEVSKKYHPTTIESLRGILSDLEVKP